ncbi:hypothetical protein CRUP_012291 [Coryphaenoides rupestris]|nr:hypothetical protein CRUP_012291 [Coryphaenoides rupestris]
MLRMRMITRTAPPPTAKLKFIVVILAAGMVAFIGAVICIIAAVHTGSSKTLPAQPQPQPPPPPQQHQPEGNNNKSLYAQTPAAAARPRSGSVARGSASGPPVGALHGADAQTPTFTAGVGVTGLGGHDPRVNRLLLRAAAEELRRTIQQQKEQIDTDQRTITELSGKLTECERGEQGGGGGGGGGRGVAGMRGVKGGGGGAGDGSAGSAAAGSAGAGGGGGKRRQHDRIMVRDGPASGPDDAAVHLLTVRAVDELEQAISQLKDRIERLETDIGPFPLQDQTADTNASRAAVVLVDAGSPGTVTAAAGVGGGAAGRRWAVEDLEGQLERKVELLEKERKTLRLESEKHRHDIDQGLRQLHLRLAGLEHGPSSSPPSFPEGFRVSFPSRTNYMYARLRASLPPLQALTACLWLRSTEERGPAGTPLSYAVPGQPNELVLLQGPRGALELLVNDKVGAPRITEERMRG